MDTIPEETQMVEGTNMIPEEPQGDEDPDNTNNLRGFKIKIICLENMEPPKKVIIKVKHNEEPVGESKEILVPDKEVKIDWEAFFEIPGEMENLLDELISDPIVFTVLCERVCSPEEDSTEFKKRKGEKGKGSKSPSEKEKSVKDPSVTNSSKKTSKSVKSKKVLPNTEELAVLGICNLDILPLLIGQRDEVEEDLLLNPTTEQKGSNIIAWDNLPKMKVSVSVKGNIGDISEQVSNIFLFTLESLHNINLDNTKEVEVATMLPNNQVIKFKSGSPILDDSVWISKRKKWHGLTNLPGQGALSSYKVSEDISDLSITTDYTINYSSLITKPRFQWNQIHRSFITTDLEKMCMDKIVKYGYWPVELIIPSSKIEQLTGEKSNTEKLLVEQNYHYIALLDLSKLIYPGEKSVKVATQLFTYTEETMKKIFGSSHSLFDQLKNTSNVQSVKPKNASSKKDAKTGSAKSKKGSVKSKEGKKKIDEIEEAAEIEAVSPKESAPVFNEEGNPIFIVAEVELLKPLVEKRKEEQILESIHKIIPERDWLTTNQLETINYPQMYEECIRNLIHNIHEEYQMFFNANECCKNSSKNFMLHLQVRGVYSKMEETLRESIISHVKEIVGPADSWGRIKYDCQFQDVLVGVYQEMANKMYAIVNSIPDPGRVKYEPEITCANLKFYECEALEENDYDKAHYYLLQRLEKSEIADSQVWVDFAKFWKNKLEFEKAEECAKEAVSLEPRKTNALMFHGLFSWLMEDTEVAEMFLLAAVSFNPFCLEGWVTLYMLHKQMGKQREANVELSHAKSCIKDFVPDNEVISNLYWFADVSEKDKIFLLTAAKLLHLSFPEFAELALSYDLLLHGRTVIYLYYLAVSHYQQGRYTSSLVHVEEALKLSWEDERLWALKGHNLFKLQKQEEAKIAYQVALNFKDRQNQHLINLRLGHILMLEGDHKAARDYYMIICRDSPTPLSWLGLGITAFVDDDMEAAELALNEANMLDCRIGRVWGYLALINLMLDRPAIFNRCILQALKYGFDDKVLLERIDSLVKLVQPLGN